MTRNAEEIVNQSLNVRSVPPVGAGDGTGHVAILLAMHNGAATLGAQLDSFLGQTHDDWSLIVSDDQSRDGSALHIRAFAARSGRPVTLLHGPGLGFAQNFLHLIGAAGPSVPFAALSDQDDVWLPGKLSRAVEHLQTVPEGRPALYAGRTVICDAALKPLRRSPEFTLPPGFRNALVQSIGGGNTMVLNRAALDLAQETARHAGGIVAHDWWLYQIVSGAGGQVFYDAEPMVLYRQHGGNLIGANDTALASLSRLVSVLRGRFRGWNTANLAALQAASHWLTPEARKVVAAFQALRSRSPARRLRALKEVGLYRQTRQGNIALTLAALLNRL